MISCRIRQATSIFRPHQRFIKQNLYDKTKNGVLPCGHAGNNRLGTTQGAQRSEDVFMHREELLIPCKMVYVI
jgi:hypothetical protein